jgi:hypothetical protein
VFTETAGELGRVNEVISVDLDLRAARLGAFGRVEGGQIGRLVEYELQLITDRALVCQIIQDD